MTKFATLLRRCRIGTLVLCLLAAACIFNAAFASAAPGEAEWTSEVLQAPTNLPPGGKGIIRIIGANSGDTASSDFPTISFELPEGVTINDPAISSGFLSDFKFWACDGSPTVTCNSLLPSFFGGPIPIPPYTYVGLLAGGGDNYWVNIPVDIAADAPEGAVPFEVTMSGGGGATASQTHQVQIGAEQLPFGFTPGTFAAGPLDQEGNPYTQAGGHPDVLTTSFALNTHFNDPTAPEGSYAKALLAEGSLKDVVVDLPPGLVGNPSATPKCPTLGEVTEGSCPPSSQIGVATVSPPLQSQGRSRMFGVYNLVAQGDSPALFAFKSPVGTVLLTPVLRSDGDMGLSVHVKNITQIDTVMASSVTIWGVPADPNHDVQRCARPNFLASACVGWDEGHVITAGSEDAFLPHTASTAVKPFLTNPTRCGGDPLVTRAHVTRWGNSGGYEPDGDPDLGDPRWVSAEDAAPPLTGCEKLQFTPSMRVRPTTAAADSPSGLEFKLEVPQSDDPDGLATPHLKDVRIELPEGMRINPASAAGLEACSTDQIGLVSSSPVRFDKLEPQCPLASKIGTIEVQTSLLEQPLEGSVFLARQSDNPFDSLVAIYMVMRSPGLLVKLAGKIDLDPRTGRLVTTVASNPQLPFDTLSVHLKSGPRAPLTTPGCGSHSIDATLTSWAAPDTPVELTDSFEIETGPGGGPCPSGKLDPKLVAGVADAVAGGHSPFLLSLSREDGTGVFSAVDVSIPEGLTGKLAGIPYCPDSALAALPSPPRAGSGLAELGSPACPAASQVGAVAVGAGSGASPFYVKTGKVYLAGPYRGAPLSLAIVTPAVAGPFDLGSVAVRSAVHVDPATTRITVESDPIPTVLSGIPLDIRDLRVAIDRPGFMQLPTNCDPKSVEATVHGEGGATATVSNRFQVGACGALGFKPRLSLKFRGQTHRSAHPALKAVLKMPKGGANVGKATVLLPQTEFIDNAHISNPCTRVQFDAGECPKSSILGTAVAHTPLLDQPLRGPIYFRSNGGARELPDLVADLDGQIHITLVGFIDSVKTGPETARVRTRFVNVPDAPVSKFVISMKGGDKGLIVNNTELCREKPRARTTFTGQNRKRSVANPLIKVACGKSPRKR